MRAILGAFLVSTAAVQPVFAAEQAAAVSSPVAGLSEQKGLLPLYLDRARGRIIVRLPAPDASGVSGRFIYTSALETGLGSAPIGLDRARTSNSRLLVFRRIGPKLLAQVENPRFRASTGTPEERAGVEDAFAGATLWIAKVEGEAADGGFYVDLAPFLLRDDLHIAEALKENERVDFRLAPDLSVADTNWAAVFPRNLELRARLTFTSARVGPEVDNIAPSDGNLAFVVRHSLIALPEPGFEPRRFDPRSGAIDQQVVDFSAPLGQPVVYALAPRFRLEKTDPSPARSPVKQPVTFYIDRAAPEPIRTALREGVAWWRDAFDAAGLVDAFRVEDLPEGASALDSRFNTVVWVNRATRGWSYGQPITDPRTGEIVRGQVLLGSLRIRQDLIIYQALVGAGLTGTGDPSDPITAALARIRQLGAHEVGHALGFAHNFAASTQGRRSVMDYPAPRVTLVDGKPDLRDAYGVGVGDWDKFLVSWLYGARTDAEARVVMERAEAAGLRFAADNDGRPEGSGHPLSSLWDDGADPVAELQRVMAVRKVALERFGPGAIPAGTPQEQLRRAFVPVWLLHRYQMAAAAKLIGGVDFTYGVAGDGRGAAKPVAAAAQRRALDAVLASISPEALTVPARLLPELSSGWPGEPDRQTIIELMPTAGGPVFDPLAATETGVAVTLDMLLAPQRLARLDIQHQADPAVPSAHEVIDRLIAAAFAPAPAEPAASVRRRIATTAALALARVQRDGALPSTTALELSERLNRLAAELKAAPGVSAEADWKRGLGRLLTDRDALTAALADRKRLPVVPPGMPIGGADDAD